MEVITMKTNELVQFENNQVLTTSRMVAEYFEKRHDHLVTTLKELTNRLKSSSPDFQGDQMFIESSYQKAA